MSLPGHVNTPDWLTLETDERVWMRTRPSKNLLLATLVLGTALLIGVGVLAILVDVGVYDARRLSSLVLVFVFVLTGAVYLFNRRHEYVVTSHRVCAAAGLTSTEVITVDLDDVDEVSVEQTGWQALLDVGTLEFVTNGADTLRFSFVENPQWARDRALESVAGGGEPPLT